MEEKNEFKEDEFVPKGAMAFFVVMIVMFAILWFSLYFELLGRG